MNGYDTDILTWSERQAELLRRVARGEPPNERPDWDNIIEEVLDAGRSELRAVRSFLFQVMLHRLKMMAWPAAQAANHWDAETRAALAQARDEYQPSMRRHIDLARIYRTAREALPEAIDGTLPLAVPEACPFTLDELLSPSAR